MNITLLSTLLAIILAISLLSGSSIVACPSWYSLPAGLSDCVIILCVSYSILKAATRVLTLLNRKVKASKTGGSDANQGQ